MIPGDSRRNLSAADFTPHPLEKNRHEASQEVGSILFGGRPTFVENRQIRFQRMVAETEQR